MTASRSLPTDWHQTDRSVGFGPIPESAPADTQLARRYTTVEVLPGQHPEADRLRRKTDEYGIEQRSLDWRTLEADISLLPHSPLALADVLGAQGGSFDLLPTADELPVAENGELSSIDAVVATHRQSRQSKPRSRANVLTTHPLIDLNERCRQLLVRHALGQHRARSRLFLVAGFVEFNGATQTDGMQRAPLLMYPVRLLHKRHGTEGLDTDAPQQSVTCDYELHVDECQPENNPVLIDHCAALHNIALPVFNPEQTTLPEFFASIAAALQKHDDVELQFDVALGTAISENLAEDSVPATLSLPALPQHFDMSLALTIAGNKNLAELTSVLQLLRDYAKPDDAPSDNEVQTDTPSSIASIRDYAERLSTEGLDNVEFQHIPGLPANIERWGDQLERILDGHLISDVLRHPSINARQLVRLGGMIELIDKAPATLTEFGHPNLCFGSTPALLRRARHQARLIEEELSALQRHFVLEKVPAKKQLLNLIEELGGHLDTEPSVVDSEYFNARRQFMEFSVDKPANLTQEHRRLLSQLAKVFRFRELFVNNVEYRLALGPGYRGLRTDWTALETTVDFARELATVVESEQLAATALTGWDEFRKSFVEELEPLQSAADAVRKLLRLRGVSWQTRSVARLHEQSMELVGKLRSWQQQFGLISSHAHLTPATVVAQFTGKSREDVITEIHVGETEAQISARLLQEDTTQQHVIDTLAWLREASALVSDRSLEIDTIVDHLQIA